MKAKFDFDMHDPDDRELFEVYRQAERYRSAIQAFDEWLRQKSKYTDEVPESYAQVRSDFWKHVNEEALDL